VESDPGLDVATVTGQYFLDFRCIFDPVLNVYPQNDMFTILHHDSPFARIILPSVASVTLGVEFKSRREHLYE
jgi:hypothetical protein